MQLTPFALDVPEAEVDDLRTRIANTRWPFGIVSDWSRGVPPSHARQLAERWSREFDWPAQQAALNAFAQFTTTVDGQTIHLVHVPSAEAAAMPLMLLHGYPSSFVEFTRMIGPLVDPVAHGGRAEDAFHVVIPSIPGFGFSTPLREPGWDVARAARAFDQIMAALGYDRYGIEGGDVGAGIAEKLCIEAGDRVAAALIVTDPGAIATEYGPPTDHLSAEEQARLDALKAARAEDFGYLALQTSRPQSIAYGLADSPVMQLTWIVEKVKEWSDASKALPGDAVDLDQLLTLASVYWFGGGGTGAANFLYDVAHANVAWGESHDRPTGFVAFGIEPLVRRVLDPEGKVPYWNEHAEGGHFPAMEVPDLLVDDLRAFFGRYR
jgi:pimeloyl-ACP methyl ester carboxylesterase